MWIDPIVTEFLLNLATTNMSYFIAKDIKMVENFLPVTILSGGRISLLIGHGGTEKMMLSIIFPFQKIRKGFIKTGIVKYSTQTKVGRGIHPRIAVSCKCLVGHATNTVCFTMIMDQMIHVVFAIAKKLHLLDEARRNHHASAVQTPRTNL